MNVRQSTTFGQLLQEYRLRAGLTQEALAERASLGRRSIQGLERGENAPQRETIQRLARALLLSPQEQTRFEVAARNSSRPRGPIADSPKSTAIPSSRRPGQAPSHALPTYLTSFVGRESEKAEIRRVLTSSRLITLTGPPGTGKTRLAVEIAREIGHDFRDGVLFVPLAHLSDPDRVLSVIAERLGLPEVAGRSLVEHLAIYLRSKAVLLVLDNFEQVVTAATSVSVLVGNCSELQVLVTSRTALRVQGEQIYPVLPFTVSDPRHPESGEDVHESDAVRLFLDRARAVKPEFAPPRSELRLVAEICRHLDGLPLAIELAAARSTILSPSAMLARLEPRLPLLTGGAYDLPERQKTLRAAIGWSYQLLDPMEQTFFRHLAVFTGGWSVEAAARVLGAGAEPSTPILDRLESLVNKSLIRLEAPAGPEGSAEPRFGMLETLREFAEERLVESEDLDALRRQHATYFVALAEEVGPRVYRPDSVIWLDRLEQDHDNFRAALRWAGEQTEATMSLRLCGALYRMWILRGYLDEGRQWLARGLAQRRECEPDDDREERLLRAQALHAAASIPMVTWNVAAARPLYEESLALFRALGDRRSIANSLHNYARVVGFQGDFTKAWSLFDESLRLWRELGESWGIAAVLRFMAELALLEGDNDRAGAFADECLLIAREDGFPAHIAGALRRTGGVALGRGDTVMARAMFDESIALFRQIGGPRECAVALVWLAKVELELGDHARARSLLREGLTAAWEFGDRGAVTWTLETFAALAVAQRQPTRTFRLAGGAEALRETLGTPIPPADRAHLEHALNTARQALGETAASVAWSSGNAMTEEQAVAYALADGED